jgi:putative pyruvate formate lyase activating enzyme
MSEPSYIKLYREGILHERAREAMERLRGCRLCPRDCKVNRLEGEQGVCKMGRKATVSSFGPHYGEESPLVGSHGSGTVFFSSCNLLCTFCQNYDISHLREGAEVEPGKLAAVMLHLARGGCHNINFVTPSHVVPQILEALIPAVEAGLDVPLVYNTGGYDSAETLKLLDGVFDIYMPDFKFWDNEWAKRLCHAGDYRERAMEALREMHRQVGDLEINDSGVATRGLLVRHLVMPGVVAGTEGVMRFLASEISRHTYVNVMDQYRPCWKAEKDAAINRRITRGEYEQALAQARQAGLYRLDDRVRARLARL